MKTRLPFEIDERIEDSLTTGYAGVPLLLELFRVSGAAAVVEEQVRIKQRKRGASAVEVVESLLALWSAGGERCEDLERLREDRALAQLIGHEIVSARVARDFLEGFHDEEALPLWQGPAGSSVPQESEPGTALTRANQRLVAHAQQRVPEKTATLDVDATILASDKRAAKVTYEGQRGYQPVFVLWAEQDLILADELRDGNVPAGSGNLRVVQKAVQALPPGVEQIRLRADSALYEHALLDWMAGQNIGFAVSADMSPQLRAPIEALPETAWQTDREEADAVRQWAEVMFVSSEQRSPQPHRYLAIRVLKKQGSLFADGSDRRHFCIVTNRAGNGLDLIRWQRGKAGTIEHTHDVLTNELAAEALPSQKFGANAAWVRLNVLLYNLLAVLRRTALPEEFRTARPKRLRFVLFNTLGRVIQHARETLLRAYFDLQRHLLDSARIQIHRPMPGLA
jgi:hypothetical protein